MRKNLLVLGGTTEARGLCAALADAGIAGIVSLAGRVARPAPLGLPLRVGGFGGVAGLVHYLRAQRITHVIDATHPFAAQMSRNAVEACAQSRTPLIALTRAPWTAQSGDCWTEVADIAAAVTALTGAPRRVMLAVGRMHLDDFAVNPQHSYLLRLVDPPTAPLAFPDAEVIVDRGPFTRAGDRALLERHRTELVVSKNAGGTGARAKIDAARDLGLPVLMIARPVLPPRREAYTIADVLHWLDHTPTDLGV